MSFGVSKARATAASWNQIQLIVAPAGGGTVSDSLREDLLAFLESKRIMTSQVTIVDPVYVQVYLDATVTVLPQFSKSLVQQQVQDVVAQLFAFDNVDFGQTIYLSKIYEIIQDISGVKGLVISRFDRSDPPPDAPQSGILSIGQNEIPTWTGFTSLTMTQ
jgi:hypothetical protein